MKLEKLFATLLLSLVFLFPQAALAQDEFDSSGDGDVEQVIPPAMVEEKGHNYSEPIDFDDIVITSQTPADHFVAATTPLVVALMLGSVGLVVYTLARGDKFE